TPGMILDMLPKVVDQLSNLGGSGVSNVLHTPLPLIHKSVADLADLGKALNDIIGTPGGQAQVQTASKFQNYLNTQLHKLDPNLNAAVVVSPGDIRFKFTYTKSVDTTLPLSFDLGSGVSFAGISGTGDLALHADLNVQLDLGINTAANVALPDRIFLGTDTGIGVDASADSGYNLGGSSTPSPLNITAHVGPFTASMQNGLAVIRLG